MTSKTTTTTNSKTHCRKNRREALVTAIGGGLAYLSPLLLLLRPRPVYGRVPGATDVCSALEQITDGAASLRYLLQDDIWSQYTRIDGEGRAGATDGARRLLGGIAPQSGTAAIAAATKTPLYRIDVAFVRVRKTVLDRVSATTTTTATAAASWEDTFDLDRFEELADRIVYNVSKCDGNFYSVLFAMKGGKMIEDIFQETKTLVTQSIGDMDEMLLLLQDARTSNTVCSAS